MTDPNGCVSTIQAMVMSVDVVVSMLEEKGNRGNVMSRGRSALVRWKANQKVRGVMCLASLGVVASSFQSAAQQQLLSPKLWEGPEKSGRCLRAPDEARPVQPPRQEWEVSCGRAAAK